MTIECLFNTVSGGCVSTFKPEHIIQKGLGGSLKSRDLICSACNQFFGNNLDHVLTSFFSTILRILSPLLPGDLMRKKLYTNSYNNGTPLIIEAGGYAKVRKFSTTINKNGMIEIRGPYESSKDKFNKVAGKKAELFEYLTEQGDYPQSLSINELLLRAVLLDLIEILRYAAIHRGTQDVANHIVIEELKRWIRRGKKSPSFPPRQIPFAPISNLLDNVFSACTFSHRLAIIYDKKQKKIIFTAQFVNTMPFVIILHDARINKTSLSVLYQKVLIDDTGLGDTFHITDKPLIDYQTIKWAMFVNTQDGQKFALDKFWNEYAHQYRRALYELDMRHDQTICKEIKKYEMKHKTETGVEAVKKIISDLVEERYLYSPYLAEIKEETCNIIRERLNMRNINNKYNLKDIIAIYRICLKSLVANTCYGYPSNIKWFNMKN